MLSTAVGYKMIAGDLTRSLATVAKKPDVSRETAYYLANIGKVKSIDDFLADDRLYKYAMKAFGLADMAYAKAFVRKALTEGVDDPKSFANRLTDMRYKDFVATFNFERHGAATTSLDQAQKGTTDRFYRQTLEEDAGAQNEGVRLALYFARKAPTLKNAYQILGDPALMKVVYTALGMPDAMARGDIDRQAANIGKRVDIASLSDPKKLERFIQRFTSMWEVSNRPVTQSNAALLIGQPVQAGIGMDLLATLQKFKIGGV